jgi:hypothetical protein
MSVREVDSRSRGQRVVQIRYKSPDAALDANLSAKVYRFVCDTAGIKYRLDRAHAATTLGGAAERGVDMFYALARLCVRDR